MQATPNQQDPRRGTWVGRLISLLFILLGLGALLFLIERIFSTEAVVAALLPFLDNFGIILPILLIFLGYYAIRLGLRLRTGDLMGATWARQILFWLMTGLIVLTIVLVVDAAFNAKPVDDWLPLSVVVALAAVVFAGAWWWLGKNLHLFHGVETLSSREARLAWNLLLPTLAVLIVLAARPLERTFINSLTDRRFAGAADQQGQFVGFDNYAQLLGFRVDSVACEPAEDGGCAVDENGAIVFPRARNVLRDADPSYRDQRFVPTGIVTIGGTQVVISARDTAFVTSIQNTLVFTFASVTLELILGLMVAMVVNSKFTGRGVMRAAMLVPWAIPTVVSAKLWEIMLRPDSSGVINNFFVGIGVFPEAQSWLALSPIQANLQLVSIILVDVWKTTPFMALILLAGLQTIPSDIYEAADVDGASKLRQFLTLTLPLLRPTIAVALVFRTLDSIRAFDVFEVLLGRQVQSMATFNQQVLVDQQQLGYASAVGVTIFIIILIFTVVYVRTLGVSAE